MCFSFFGGNFFFMKNCMGWSASPGAYLNQKTTRADPISFAIWWPRGAKNGSTFWNLLAKYLECKRQIEKKYFFLGDTACRAVQFPHRNLESVEGPLKRPQLNGRSQTTVQWLVSEWEKVWSRLSTHLQPFFRLIARILTIFDKKYRILTHRDKRESYLIVLQQNNV